MSDQELPISLLEDPETAFVYKPRKSKHAPVSVADVWALIKKRKTRKEIRKALPPITNTAIDKAESFMMEKHPEKYERVFGKSRGKMTICIDECVPWHFGSTLHKAGFGKIFSVAQSGLGGTKDPALWGHLIRNSVHCIITRDGRNPEPRYRKTKKGLKQLKSKHLTTLARKSREARLSAEWFRTNTGKNKLFPLVIILDHSIEQKDIPHIIEENAAELKEFIRDRENTVYVRLSNNGISKILDIDDMKESQLEQPTFHAIKELEKRKELPRKFYKAAANLSPSAQYAHNQRRKKAIDELKKASIAFAKAEGLYVDANLIRYVAFLLYGDASKGKEATKRLKRLKTASQTNRRHSQGRHPN